MNIPSVNSLTSAVGGTPQSLNQTPYFKDLRPASWRGIPFGISRIRHAFGRKNVIHNYPYVDGVYVEDLGQSGKKYYIQGFLIEGGGAYGTGTLKEQIARMDRAISQPGNAVLVHPLLGAMPTIALIDYECEIELERGRVAELTFSFIDNSAKKMPSVVIDTVAQTQIASAASLLGQLQDFGSSVHNLVRSSIFLVQNVVNQFTTTVHAITFTATSLVTMVSALPGQIGRMVGQSFPSSQKNAATTVQILIGLGSASQSAVLQSTTTLKSSAAAANTAGIGTGIQSVVAALLAANPDPSQAIQSMIALIANSAGQPQATPALTATTGAVTDLIRRAACAGMAQASASYQPISYQDAQNIRTLVCGAIQAEMDIAGDQGLDATYNSLRDLKLAVARDLTRRGASLSNMILVSSAVPVSSLVWSQRLYQDSAREPEIVNDGNPIHPCFMPIKFNALAS